MKSHHELLSPSTGTKPASLMLLALKRCVTVSCYGSIRLLTSRWLELALANGPFSTCVAELSIASRCRAPLSAFTFGLSVGHLRALQSRPAAACPHPSPWRCCKVEHPGSSQKVKAAIFILHLDRLNVLLLNLLKLFKLSSGLKLLQQTSAPPWRWNTSQLSLALSLHVLYMSQF